MIIFTPNTVIKSADVNTNFNEIYDGFAKATTRRNNASGTITVSDTYIDYGFVAITGNGTTDISQAVVFNVTFDSAPIVFVSLAAAKTTPESDNITTYTTTYGGGNSIAGFAQGITTTDFTLYGRRSDAATFGITTAYPFCWLAIGSVSR